MTKISQIPQPPTTQDSINFNIRADEFLDSLPRLTKELNAFVGEMNNIEEDIKEKTRKHERKAIEEISLASMDACKKINLLSKEKQKKLDAIEAVKSNSWESIAVFILFQVRKIRRLAEKEKDRRERILERGLFLKRELPKGYVRAGCIIKARDYPLAFLYLNINREYFILPTSNQNNMLIEAYYLG